MNLTAAQLLLVLLTGALVMNVHCVPYPVAESLLSMFQLPGFGTKYVHSTHIIKFLNCPFWLPLFHYEQSITRAIQISKKVPEFYPFLSFSLIHFHSLAKKMSPPGNHLSHSQEGHKERHNQIRQFKTNSKTKSNWNRCRPITLSSSELV